MNSIHERLEGGDLRSIGKADLVLEDLYKIGLWICLSTLDTFNLASINFELWRDILSLLSIPNLYI